MSPGPLLATTVLVLAGCAGCVADPGAPFAVTDERPEDGDPEDSGSPDCPADTVFVPGGTFVLGEEDEAALAGFDPNMAIRTATFEIDDTCVVRFPFPGVRGAAWPQDGLSLDQMARVESLLEGYARRVCTVPELLLAAAGPDNWRFPYDAEDHRPDVCDSDDVAPRALGTFDGCISPTGVRDFMVRSTWGRVTDGLVAALEPHGLPWPGDDEHAYVPYGGAARQTTHYAASNFGVHTHGEGEPPYADDGLRVCRTPSPPDPEEEEDWAALLDQFSDTGRFEDFVGL